MANRNEQRLPQIDDEAVRRRVEHDHRAIPELLRDLCEAVDVEALGRVLGALEAVLSRHFADEEAVDGLFESLRTQRPAVGSRLEKFALEHREIERDVTALQRRMGRPGPQLQELRERAQELQQRIRQHERSENLLFTEVYYTDDGGSG